jgi:hypothetical protein
MPDFAALAKQQRDPTLGRDHCGDCAERFDVADALDAAATMERELRETCRDPKRWVQYYLNSADGDADAIPVNDVLRIIDRAAAKSGRGDK